MTSRTIRDFGVEAEIWPTVAGWAAETGFRLKESSDSQRLYQKGRGFLVAPMMLEISSAAGQVHLEAWVRANVFARLMALFLIPAEMGVESGGFRMVAPRRIARQAINKLLERLGQSPIP